MMLITKYSKAINLVHVCFIVHVVFIKLSLHIACDHTAVHILYNCHYDCSLDNTFEAIYLFYYCVNSFYAPATRRMVEGH